MNENTRVFFEPRIGKILPTHALILNPRGKTNTAAMSPLTSVMLPQVN